MPAKIYRELEFPSDYPHAKAAEDRIVNTAEKVGHAEDAIFALRLSLEEAFSNAIRHGNANDKTKRIKINYYIDNCLIDVFVADEGKGFNPGAIPDPTLPENLVNPSGRGILLMRAYMDLVEFNRIGNQVHLVKYNEDTPPRMENK